jgi:CBS domain-containing protein
MPADLTVRDLMCRDVKTLNQNDRLTIADELMRMDRIRHLPVINDEEELVGIVSQRDLFRSALSRALGYGERAQQKLMEQLMLKEVMTKPVQTIGPDAPITEAARLMADQKIGCLVVTQSERIVGILTEGDFVRHLAG